jgi:RNA polymerase sigma factor (TIGR02999 family)
MAGARMARERPGHTLQATALVNEAYLRLAPGEKQWENRAHFFGAAAHAMRRILVDHARRHQASKRGGEARRVTFDDLAVAAGEPGLDLLALDQALDALAEEEPRLAEVVHLRYFAGLGITETAALLDTSPATVKRDWTFARAWLLERMS